MWLLQHFAFATPGSPFVHEGYYIIAGGYYLNRGAVGGYPVLIDSLVYQSSAYSLFCTWPGIQVE
jgi:hypothetical protein